MTRGLVTSSRFSPGNMSGEALERLFVGRDPLMKDVLKRIAASATREEKHFVLLIGPRGMGKTHFVSLAHHKLKHDAAYAKTLAQLKIAYLNEEEWGVASFLDLLVRILRALVAEHGDPQLKAGIDHVYEAFKRSPDSALELAESLLVKFLKGHTLLLICENLEDLFEGLGEEGQKRWRSFIQEHPFWTILATTPALFSGIRLQTSPFYNFFTIKSLDRLDFETAVELLRQKALLEGHPKLADFLRTPTGRARVRAIHHLAGGNHRVYVIMSDFLDEESLENLFTPFMRMADDLTPYYQDRMRQLTPQQRKLVEFLSQEARPVIVKDIATRCLLSPQVAAKQLGELAKLNFVVSTKVGRESHYELSEPLMRICVDIKDNRTDHFRLFVDFLRHWFTGRELQTKLERLKHVDASGSQVDRVHLTAAIQDFVMNPREPFLESLDKEIRQCVKAHDFQGIVDTVPRLLQERPSLQYFVAVVWSLINLKQFDKALEYANRSLEKYPDESVLHLCKAQILWQLGRLEEGLENGRRAIELTASADIPALTAYAYLLRGARRSEQILEVARKILELEPENLQGIRLLAMASRDLGRYSDAEEVYRRGLKSHPQSAPFTSGLMRMLRAQGKFTDAIECAVSSPEPVLEDASVLTEYGAALAGENRLQEAVLQFDKVLEKVKDRAGVYVMKARALLQLGQRETAREACRAVLGLAYSEGLALDVASILFDAGYPEEVLAVIDHWQAKGTASALAWMWRARALVPLSRYKDAQAAIEKARQLAPADLTIAVLEAEILVGVGGFGVALEALGRILANRPQNVGHGNLVVGLCNMLFRESSLRGAIAMARQLPQLRQLLEAHDRLPWMAEVFSIFVRAGLIGRHFSNKEWPLAIPILQETFKDLPQCRIPLSVLSVAIRYQQDGDESALLELPLEQRTLLMDILKSDRKSGPIEVAVESDETDSAE